MIRHMLNLNKITWLRWNRSSWAKHKEISVRIQIVFGFRLNKIIESNALCIAFYVNFGRLWISHHFTWSKDTWIVVTSDG